jgi:hypothetical protein
MRLWSLHPKYLDARGLVAVWREGLLAQKVLQGKTKGYRNHPQLIRFKNHPDPAAAIGNYLAIIWDEANRRGYRFDKTKIAILDQCTKIPVTAGQLKHEWEWLMSKLRTRDTDRYKECLKIDNIECHPLFEVVDGPIADWEYPVHETKSEG